MGERVLTEGLNKHHYLRTIKNSQVGQESERNFFNTLSLFDANKVSTPGGKLEGLEKTALKVWKSA